VCKHKAMVRYTLSSLLLLSK